MRQIEKILSEIAQENGLPYKSYGSGWVLKVGNALIDGYHFPLNPAGADRLCDDKAATYEVLSANGIAAVRHDFLTKEMPLPAWVKFDGKEVVVKPNDGTGGVDVERIASKTELEKRLQKLFVKFDRLSLSPFISIKTEYRAIILAGQVEIFYAKHLQNAEDWKFNLGQGATPELLGMPEKLKTLACQTSEALGIHFASIDIIETSEEQYQILEVNSGVMVENFSKISKKHYEQAKALYQKAIRLANKKSL